MKGWAPVVALAGSRSRGRVLYIAGKQSSRDGFRYAPDRFRFATRGSAGRCNA